MNSVYLEHGRISVQEMDIPDRPPGFALIRMRVAGICNTDLELQCGYYGFSGTPGHEFAGEVVEADTPSLMGSVSSAKSTSLAAIAIFAPLASIATVRTGPCWES